MANIEEISGAFGGVKIEGTEGAEQVNIPAEAGTLGATGTMGIENAISINESEPVAEATVGTNLPAKTGFWNKVKSVLFYEIKVELTPYQQKVEDEINEFLHQEITWGKIKDFLFKDISFGKKKEI